MSQNAALTAPTMNDSDIMRIIIGRLEKATRLMEDKDYGPELDEHLAKVEEILTWLTGVIEARKEPAS
ncbi:hypothetical protein [Nesterenkonia flava]|uniref:Uncharacterized protein n=1 Tax=Nesterenkonia flava TaxID=469799 RepID=A0ABU1FW84_9MICC|nr:hypothetical protein [Nesterenkonia flava]MDR5712944.1 hypothetical protein [Nesterenkonia flava]